MNLKNKLKYFKMVLKNQFKIAALKKFLKMDGWMDGSQGGKKILHSKFNQTYNSIMYVLHEQYTSNVFLRKHFKLIEVHAVFSLNIYEHTVALATSIRYIQR